MQDLRNGEPVSLVPYSTVPLKNISILEKNLKTYLQLLSIPAVNKDIRIMYGDIQESLEEKIIQSLFEVCNFLSDPKILKKYKINLKISKWEVWTGSGLKHIGDLTQK